MFTGRQFGFQPDNLFNQLEHVQMLLANARRGSLDQWDQALISVHLKECG
jgi:hypothetical protein